MKTINELGQVISADVLIIGGGISGVLAGIKAKEKGANVLVVDKGGIGWAGSMPITGGYSMFLLPEQLEEWFKWVVETGGYLSNQDWTYTVGSENHKLIMEGAELGLPFIKTDGELALVHRDKYYTTTRYEPSKFMVKLKSAAASRGIRMMDKIFIVDLLRHNDKVVGAVGFGMVDGKTYIFKAKATIIANGSYMAHAHNFFVVNTGDGASMAYRAGAQLMNIEFGNVYGFGFKAGGIRRRSPMFLFYENALGERFVEKYHPELMSGLESGKEIGDFSLIVDAMGREIRAGRGPIYIDLRKLTPEERQIALRYASLPSDEGTSRGSDFVAFFREKTGLDMDKEKVEVAIQCYGGPGPIRVGLDCNTTVEGLWAVGDACGEGSGWLGARPIGTYPGFGVAFTMVTGGRGGQSAREYAVASPEVQVEYAEVKKAIERMLAPLGRRSTIACHEVTYQIQEAVVPIEYNLYREAGRLNEALGKIDTAKQHLAGVGAKDHHELSFYYQAESMALGSELTLRAALLRNESRGTHIRDDCPDRDDKNWLKWIVIKEDKGKAKFFTESVPLEKYKLKPSIR